MVSCPLPPHVVVDDPLEGVQVSQDLLDEIE
jgi:hypothetical protein